MILVIEVLLAIMGVKALVTGRLQMTGSKVVVGGAARAVGFIALMPVPIVLAIGVAILAMVNPPDPERFAADNQWTFIGIEAGVVLGMVVLIAILCSLLGKSPAELEREQPRDDF